ncbi:hypothetical protein LWM68_40875 [Niabella sp. W65]|nr:hypothetical protein [Niabella sp. W65]MCH7368527.1 hypothetical protein [Niabella sp. W65]
MVQQREEERQARINPDPEDEPPPPQEQKPDNKPAKSDKNRREKLRALWSAAKAVFSRPPTISI